MYMGQNEGFMETIFIAAYIIWASPERHSVLNQ